MPLTIGSALTNPSDVIGAFHNEINTRFGANYTAERNTGTIGANTLERWWTIPGTHTGSGQRIVYGMKALSADVLQQNVTYFDFATASASGARAFDRFDAQPMYSASTNGASTTAVCTPAMNLLNTGANYLRHWIFTNAHVGQVTANYDVGERFYMHMVMEASSGVYRSFGIGELSQIGAWPTTASGLYVTGCYSRAGDLFTLDGTTYQSSYFGSHKYQALGGDQTSGPTVVYQPDRDGAGCKWLFLCEPIIQGGSPNPCDMMRATESRMLGRDHLNVPSVFSGIALRVPIRYYATAVTAAQALANGLTGWGDTAIRMQPLGEIPDVFFVNIRDLDPGTVFVDGTERFLVVPLRDKANVTLNQGLLFRNPGL